MHLGQDTVPTFDDLLTTGSTWLLVALAAWTLTLGIAATCEVCTSGRLRATALVPCPAGLRRGVLAALGVAIGTLGVVTLPAAAVATPAGASTGGRGAGPATLPVPERPDGGVAPTAPAPGERPTAPAVHVVQVGDTLWAVAESRLPGASATEVARLVTRIHDGNREVIGADPDHIVPGQRLALPRLPHSTLPHAAVPSTEENR
jgi:hypothetical protein